MKKFSKIIAMLAAVMMLCTFCLDVYADAALTPAGQVTQSQSDVKWFYNSKGEKVNASQLGENDACVQLSKKVESAGSENDFKVTLEVLTTEDLTTLPKSRDAAVMLILDNSSSMNFSMGQGTVNDRMTVLQKAADKFLQTFAQNTDARPGERRLAAIVTFNQNAQLHMPWIDLCSTTVVEGVEKTNLSIAADRLKEVPRRSGTNVEGGIHAAASYMNASKKPGGMLENVDYIYTIFISDGEPGTGSSYDDNKSFLTVDMTQPGAMIKFFNNDNNEDGMGKLDRFDTVGDGIEVIRGLSKMSDIYGVCLAASKNHLFTVDAIPTPEQEAKLNPTFSGRITVGEWIQLFCDYFYPIDKDDISGLNNAFANIASKIQIGTAAFHVNDAMGSSIRYDGAADSTVNDVTENGDAFMWDLRNSARTQQTITVGGESKTAYKYTYTYKTHLNNLDISAETNMPVNDNEKTELHYIASDANGRWPATSIYDAKLPVPQVQGYAADLIFTKVEPDGTTPLKGAEFTLTHDRTQCSCGFDTDWSDTCTSGADGAVKFTDIPSGHTYTLIETPPTGFVSAGVMKVVTSLGSAVLTGNGVSGSEGSYVVTNKLDEGMTGNLTITKQFSGHAAPASVRFDVEKTSETGMDYKTTVTLNAANNWSVTLKGIPSGIYAVKEVLSDAAFENYDHTVKAAIDDNYLNVDADQSHAGVEVIVPQQGGTMKIDFTNVYEPHMGKIVLRKTIDHITQYAAGSPANGYMEKHAAADRAAIENGLGFSAVNAAGSSIYNLKYSQLSAVAGQDYVEYSIDVPVGEYTLLETSEFNNVLYQGTIDQLSYTLTDAGTKYHIAQGNTISGYVSSDGQRAYVDKDETVIIHYTNKYRIPLGTLNIQKVYAGIPDEMKEPEKAGGMYFEIKHAEDDDVTGRINYTEFGRSSSTHSTGDLYRINRPNMPTGKYYVTEKNPPDFSSQGYRYVKTEWSLNPNNGFKDQSTTPALSGQVFETSNGVVIFLNTYVPQGKLTIREKITGDLTDAEIIELLKTMTFTVKDATSGNTVGTFSGADAAVQDGCYVIKTDLVLDEGTYTVTQTGDALALYEKTDGVKATSANSSSESAASETEVIISHDDWEKAATVEFTDHYTTKTAIVQFTGRKEITGRAFSADDRFTFNLEGLENAPMPENSSVTIAPAQDAKFAFGVITYTAHDVGRSYTYRISEAKEAVAGITYDDTVYQIVVTVSQTNDGGIVADAEIRKDTDVAVTVTDKIVFANTYTASGNVTLSAHKVLIGKTLEAEQFSFVLKDAQGQRIATAKNAADGSITFTTLAYAQEDAGKEFVYTISEEDGGKAGYTYDLQPQTVTVTVTDNGNGTLTASADKTGRAVTFTNSYSVTPTAYTPKASKALTGEIPTETSTFTFLLTADEANPADGANVASGTASAVGEGDASFGDITFTKAGVYRFEITERNDALAGYHYDSTPWILTVTVEDRDSRLTVASVSYVQQKDGGMTSDEKAVFTNAFSVTSAVFAPSVTKVVEGVPLRDETHIFTIREAGEHPQDSLFMPSDLTASVTGAGEAVFENITFLRKGVYTFAITENAGSNSACMYDDSEWLLTVNVTEEDSILSAEGVYTLNGEAGEPVFVNFYRPGGIAVTKTVTGTEGDLNRLFTFTLTVKLPDGALHEGAYALGGGTGAASAVRLANGGSFCLKHGQRVEIHGLPVGAMYEVKELEADLNGYKTTAANASGMVKADETVEVSFQNHHEPAKLPQTGDRSMPMVCAMLCLLALTSFVVICKKRYE